MLNGGCIAYEAGNLTGLAQHMQPEKFDPSAPAEYEDKSPN